MDNKEFDLLTKIYNDTQEINKRMDNIDNRLINIDNNINNTKYEMISKFKIIETKLHIIGMKANSMIAEKASKDLLETQIKIYMDKYGNKKEGI